MCLCGNGSDPGRAGDVGQAEIVPALYGYGSGHLDLSSPLSGEPEGFLCVIHRGFSLS